jgi:hypothetical protein
MFPTPDFSLNGPLRCYQDNNTALYLNPYHYPDYGWNHEDCEEIITGIEETGLNRGTAIFPNPAATTISIRNITQPTAYKIYNPDGRMMLSGTATESSEINISGLAQGIYFIQMGSEYLMTTLKIIKQ